MLDLLSFTDDHAGIEADEEGLILWDQRTGRGGKSPTQQTHRRIPLTPRLAEFLARYLGDGRTSLNGQTHISYTSVDVELVKKHIDDLEDLVGIPRYKHRIYLHVPEGKKTDGIHEGLEIRKTQIKSYHGKRHRQVSITAQYGNSLATPVFLKLADSILEPGVLDDTELHAGFLRGLFAAEGCVQINRKIGCLVALEFTLHREEYRLQAQLERSLAALAITYNVRDMKHSNSRATTITGWKNYSRAWMNDLFSGCSRKEIDFENQVQETDLQATVSSDFKTYVRDVWADTQTAARRTGISYYRLLRWFDGTSTLSVSELIKVATASNLKPDAVLASLESISAHISDDIEDVGFAERYWNHLEEAEIIP